jgi:hypothetical protein
MRLTDPQTIRMALSLDPRQIERAFLAARAEAFAARQRLHELELETSRAWELFEVSGARIPWPPLPGPVRPPTLHEAMRAVLELRNNSWMRPRDLAVEIAKRGMYRRRDGLPATAKDVSARASSYPGLFVRDGWVVRLRLGLFVR